MGLIKKYRKRLRSTTRPRNRAMLRRRLQKDLPALIILAVLCLLVYLVCFLIYVKIGKPFYDIMTEPNAAKNWILSHGTWSYLFFVGVVFLQVVVAVIPGEPFQIAAGLAFGPIVGTILTTVGIMLGAITAFLMARVFGYRLLERLFSARTLSKINMEDFDNDHVEEVVFIAFIIPGTPKDVMSYAVGLAPISLKAYIRIILIARLPSITMASISGNAINDGNYLTAAIYLVIGMLCSVIMYFGYRFIKNRRKA